MADNPDVNPPNPQNHLLIKKTRYDPPEEIYTLYADDNTFSHTSRILQAPELVNTLKRKFTLDSIDGWQFFYGEYLDRPNTKWAVKWNPSTNECDRIEVTPNVGYQRSAVGFGGHTITDLKLVKISFRGPNDEGPETIDVDVWTLATDEWSNVIRNEPFMPFDLECAKVYVDGVIYFRAFDNLGLPLNQRSNFFYSFNLETEVFGLVPLPSVLEPTGLFIQSVKVNGSLGLVVYHDHACVVWTYDAGANQFAINHTIAGHNWYGDLLGYRNNGEAVVELRNAEVANIGLYNPLTAHLNRNAGIHGNPYSFVVRPYFGNVAYD